MGLLKFFAAVFGVSDALSNDDIEAERIHQLPKLEKLNRERATFLSQLDQATSTMNSSVDGETRTSLLNQIDFLERKLRDTDRLIDLYQNM